MSSLNAGRPLLLGGGLDWKAMSLTPKDMDVLEARHTVIPLVHRIAAALTCWLAAPLSPTLSIRPDFDAVDALTGDNKIIET